jgi:hypothetical protein
MRHNADILTRSRTMTDCTFRNYAGPEDAERQYRLWLAATEDLPRAWRSNRNNVRSLIKNAEQHPQARIYAERPDAALAGYIGTYAPFEWKPGWWTLPFGFPWTHPHDADLERELYDRMLTATPDAYPGVRRDAYIQRFRASWAHPVGFMQARGWSEAWRYPIVARAVDAASTSSHRTVEAVTDDRLEEVCTLATADPHAADKPTVEQVRGRLKDGWLMPDWFRIVPDAGVFALEIRPPWAEVKFFASRPQADALRRTLSAVDALAREQGASEVYFTLADEETERQRQLAEHGFREVDAGVYLTCEV